MKKIIKGKRYDTETATSVAHYDNGLGHRDFRNVSETLYRTPRGKWFLVGEGGAMTQWGKHFGDGSRCGGEGLRPLTEDQAQEWLEYHEYSEEIELYFADSIEDA